MKAAGPAHADERVLSSLRPMLPFPPLLFSVLLLGVLVGGCTNPPSERRDDPGGATAPPPHFRNLVVVMVDTLRADHLPSYGYERDTAPFLARLAVEGVQFDGYSASSWTRPSIATLLTGASPQRHQVIGRVDFLSSELPYLPAILSEHGYSTAAYVGNLNASRKWGFGRGFAHYRQTRPTSNKDDAARVNAAASELIEAVSPPFFLWLHYVDPHAPYEPELAWGEQEGTPLDRYQPRRLTGAERSSPVILDRMRDQYDGEILELDRALEALFEMLDERALLDSTLVVVTSDHGEEFGEHGDLTHGRSLYQEVIHVPLLFWARNGVQRSAHPGRFHQIDFLPTVLEALDVPGVDGLSGTSRWSSVHSAAEPADQSDYFFHLDLDGRGMLGLLQDTHDVERKLVLEIEPGGETLHASQFDLDQDPGERQPLPPDPALSARLIEQHNREGRLSGGRQEEILDPVRDKAVRAQLEALGYLEASTEQAELRLRLLPDAIGPDAIQGGPPPR